MEELHNFNELYDFNHNIDALSKLENLNKFNEIKESILLHDIHYYFNNPVKIEKREYYIIWEKLFAYFRVKEIQNEVKNKITRYSNFLNIIYQREENKRKANLILLAKVTSVIVTLSTVIAAICSILGYFK